MLRRLFFLFPDEPHAQGVVDELMNRNIPERRIHAIAQNVALKTLPQASKRQINDTAFKIERVLWSANLLVFAIALGTMAFALYAGNAALAVISFAVMVVTFFTGEYFAVHVPDVHLSEFTAALSHGEILLMVDVPAGRVTEIENFVHHGHPEVVGGGVSWTVESFGI